MSSAHVNKIADVSCPCRYFIETKHKPTSLDRTYSHAHLENNANSILCSQVLEN